MRSVLFGVAFVALSSHAMAAANGSITGQAFIQTPSGIPQTCAGQDDVVLLSGPVAAGLSSHNIIRGMIAPQAMVHIPSDAPTATCDADGRFSFSNVVPGSYTLVSKIVWSGGQQGGYVIKPIDVVSDENTNAVLSGRIDAPAPPVAAITPQRDPRHVTVENAVRARLLDPSSAQFEWSNKWLPNTEFKMWRWSRPVRGDVTCGRVNARNRMGGYTGQSTFLVVVANGTVAALQMESTADSELSFARLRCQRDGFF